MTADAGASGTGTLMFTADNYAMAMVTVEIRPAPAIELSVLPAALEIVSGMSAELTITATPTAMITIISDDDNIASVAESAAAFELEGGANNSTRISVSGGNVDRTRLTIEASMTGYTTETATVEVDVLESLRIAATPVSVVLVAGGDSTQINVSVSRVVGESVTVAIEATDGLSVAQSVTLTNLDAMEVAVTADAGASGTGTLMFTADNYAMAMVTVEIRPAPAIELSVLPAALEIVSGMNADLTITATPTAMITIISDNDNIASVAESAAAFELEGGANNSTRISVSGGNVDRTRLTIEASMTGYTTETATVDVDVLESLRIAATPVSVVLVAGGDSTQINVSVSRVVGESVTVAIEATAGLSVAQSVTLTNLDAIEVAVTADAGASGTGTLMFTADNYAMAMVTIEIRPAPAIELSVLPAALEIVTGERAELMLTATPTAMITIISDNDNIASVAESAAAFELEGGANNSTRISVSGGNVDRTRLTIEASMTGYTTETATVEVDVLESLRIAATPVSVVLVAGGDSTQINVSVSRVVGESVRVDIDATVGLSVAQSVTLTNLDAIEVAVTADAGASGTGTLMFTADNYAMAMVTVEIRPAPAIELSVLPAALEIVSGMSAELTITVTPTAMITIISDNDNIASVAESAAAFELEGGANNSTRISVSGGNVDRTRLTIEASMTGYTTETATVEVNVIESLRIAATPVSVVLVAGGASTQINVSVSRVVGESVRVDIDATAGLSVAVEPSSVTLTNLDAIEVAVTATAPHTGRATLTFTADNYAMAMVTVEIRPAAPLPAIELSVLPAALVIVTGERAELMLTVTPTAMITIISDNDNIASVAESAAAFMLEGGANNSTRISVSGGNVDRTRLTIEASMTGYTTATATVEVDVLESLRIAATPVSVVLVAGGAGTQIDVSVSRLIEGSVTVAIEATDGLSVDPGALTLANTDAIEVEVTADAGASGTGTLTFTADNYAMAMVTVEIRPAAPLPAIELSVMPSPLVIVTGERAELTITVTPTATITIISDNDNIASVAESAAAFMLEGGANNSTRISVSGGNVDRTRLTIEASMTGYTTETATVEVDVLESLRIAATPVSVDLVAGGASTQINVSVSRVVGESVRVDIDATAGLSVAQSVTLENLDAMEVEVTADAGASGTGTLMFTADNYAMAMVTVEIRPAPAIELSVLPAALEIVSGMSAELTITVTPTAMITIISDNDNIASVAESAAAFELEGGANNSTRISVSGGNVDRTRLTIEASMTGYTTETATVEVNVIESLRIAATPVSVVLVAGGASTQINVSVSRVVGESVRVDIDATAGLSVAQLVTLTNLDAIEVEVTADAGASGTGTLMFTADNYAMAMVTVEIRPAPAIELSVLPAALEIVSGMSAELTITATPTATITIISDNDNIASVAESAAAFELEGGANNSTRISVSGGNVDTTTLTITATADGHTDTMVSVAVEVIESLEIFATPVSVVLVAGGDSTQINVSVSRVVGESVRVDIDASAGLSVARSVTLENLDAIEVAVTALAGASGTGTLMFTATDYAPTTVTVEIRPAPPEPPIGDIAAVSISPVRTR